MNFKITNEEENELDFKLEGESHGFSNLLLKTLQDMDEVRIAQYGLEHPKEGEPDFHLETREEEPLEVLEKATEQIENQAEELESQIEI